MRTKTEDVLLLTPGQPRHHYHHHRRQQQHQQCLSFFPCSVSRLFRKFDASFSYHTFLLASVLLVNLTVTTCISTKDQESIITSLFDDQSTNGQPPICPGVHHSKEEAAATEEASTSNNYLSKLFSLSSPPADQCSNTKRPRDWELRINQLRRFPKGYVDHNFQQQLPGTHGRNDGSSQVPEVLLSDCRYVTPSEVICDNERMTEIPRLGAISSQNLSLFQLNHTKVRSLRPLNFYGHSIENIVLENNPVLSVIDPRAFHGLNGLKYLKIKGNRLKYPKEASENYFLLFSELNQLSALSLEDNRLNFTNMKALSGGDENSSSSKYMNMPCLEYLSLKGNPLTKLHKNVFLPFSCSPITELHLRSCELLYIHSGNHNGSARKKSLGL